MCLFLGGVHTVLGHAEWNPLGSNSSKEPALAGQRGPKNQKTNKPLLMPLVTPFPDPFSGLTGAALI